MREKLGVLQGEGGEDSAISIPRKPVGIGAGCSLAEADPRGSSWGCEGYHTASAAGGRWKEDKATPPFVHLPVYQPQS